MKNLKNYIFQQVANKRLSQQEAEVMLKELANSIKVEKEIDDIAIIGISGKFGESSNLDEFWEMLINQKKCNIEFPEDRIKDGLHMLDVPLYQEALSGQPISHETVKYSKACYLKDGIDKFDPGFFKIPPREAKFIEPAHRLFLETSWEAIEDAGYGGDKIYGTNTGVFVGRDTTVITLYKHMTELDPMHLTGSWSGILASRISYIFNLQGPSILFDTACSAGLVALHSACKSLRNKECEMAIAGGVHIFYTAAASKNGDKTIMDLDMVESEDYTARPFDKDANGTLWGEGVGAVFLKPLKKAIEDGDNIYAVIKGSAINNDGASNGITAPSAIAQEKVIIEAWKDAKINPETISYIEAHGTATNLGDPIEIFGITSAFSRYTDRKQFCGIGSNKGNIGHTVAASGIASLMKIILSLKHNVLPPSANFREPNKHIDFNDSPVYVNDRKKPWVKGSVPRRAGISSFGFSGTNCHVILEEAPEIIREEKIDLPLVVKLSGRNDGVLRDLVKKYKGFLEVEKNVDLQSLCYTANTGRGQYSSRLIFIIKDLEDFKNKINKVMEVDFSQLIEEDIYYGHHKVVFDNKQIKEADEIGDGEKRQLTKAANEKIGELANHSDKKELLDEICKLWVRGADIIWDKLYEGKKLRKISIPVYPLERLRIWAEPKQSKLKDQMAKPKKEYKHPLLDRCLVDTIDTAVFSTDFSVDNHWVLKEHVFLGNYIMPGIAYLELAREACSKVYHDNNMELRDVMFPQPLVVEENEVKEVHTIVKKNIDHLHFTIASKFRTEDEGEDVWITHAEGKAYPSSGDRDIKLDINQVMENCSGNIAPDEDLIIPGKKRVEKPFVFGIRWESIYKSRYGEDMELVELKLNESVLGDIEEFYLHPSQLDNALNATLVHIKYDTYLPFSYKSIKIHRPLTGHFYSLIKRKNELNTGLETLSFDVTMLDLEGNVLVEVEHYTIKKVKLSDIEGFKNRVANKNSFYQLKWSPEKLEVQSSAKLNGCTIVFKGNNPVANSLFEGLKDVYTDVIEVNFGDEFKNINRQHYIIGGNELDFNHLFNELKERTISEIVYLPTIAMAVEDTEELRTSQEIGVMGLFYITRAILNEKIKGNIKISLITDHSHPVTGNEEVLTPHNASLLGLGRVIPQEHPNITCHAIDIDYKTEASHIIGEIISEGEKCNVAFREGIRYVAELEKVKAEFNNEDGIQYKPEGIYVITGGTGGIGLEMAKNMAQKGAKNLALINRSQFPHESQWDKILEDRRDTKLINKITILQEMIEEGCSIKFVKGDINSLEDTTKMIAQLRDEFKSINGILHCAGLAGDGFIMNKDEKVFRNVLNPKIQGTWNLHQSTLEDDLDFFVLFSSMTTLQNLAGQGDYTAANSFLNSFAAYRNKLGKKTVAINWPGWKETGMAVDHNASGDEADEYLMFKSIPTKKAIEAFDAILNTNFVTVATGVLNHRLIGTNTEQFSFKPSQRLNRTIQDILAKAGDATGPQGIRGNRGNKDVVIKGKGEEDRSNTENILALIFAGVLGLDEIDLYTSFHQMGGDSILATQLVKEIEKVFPGLVDITDIFTHSSVDQLASYIEDKTGSVAEDVVVEEKIEESEKDDLRDLFDSLLEDEVAATEE